MTDRLLHLIEPDDLGSGDAAPGLARGGIGRGDRRHGDAVLLLGAHIS